MPVQNRLSGLWPPIATPFDGDGAVDHGRLAALAGGLIDEGARGLVLLGTTGEANSLSLVERHTLIDAVVDRGFDPKRLIVGSGACAYPEAVELTRHAASIGAAAVLLLPPFYYKPVSEDGLFAFVAEVIGRSGAAPPPVLLYHFPSLATVGWSFDLIRRLIDAFPGVVVGIKDSSGDEAHTARLIASFPGFAVFPGSESSLLTMVQAGAAGFITTSGNVNARALAALMANPTGDDAERRLAEANAVRNALKARGLFASVKAVIARRMRDDAWLAVRPPLMPLGEADRSALYAEPAITRLLDKANAAA
jgi:4-hydroxy-tetrahydrodipicolinate synthase